VLSMKIRDKNNKTFLKIINLNNIKLETFDSINIKKENQTIKKMSEGEENQQFGDES
jgi:hypothetical protein